MKSIFSRLVRSQSGQGVLAIVLILVILGALIIGPLLAFMSTGLKAGQMHESKEQGLYAADSGLEDAINWLIHGKPTEDDWDWTWNGAMGERSIGDDEDRINDRTIDVIVEALAEANTYKVTSTATGSDGSTTVLSIVWAIIWFDGDQTFGNQNPPPQGDVHVEGDVTLEGNIVFTGTMTASGSITTFDNVQVTGNIGVGGDLVLRNNSQVMGTVCIAGNVAIGNGCILGGVVRCQAEDATITLAEAGCAVPADIWADGNLTIDIDTNAPVEGTIYAPNGNIDIYLRRPNALIIGDIYASGTIQVLVEEGTHTGTKYPGYGGPPPFPEPECPVPPDKKSDILTYAVT